MLKQNRNGLKCQLFIASLTAVLGSAVFANAAEEMMPEPSQAKTVLKSELKSELKPELKPVEVSSAGSNHVQAVSLHPMTLPKKPPYPPVKPGYYQGNIVLSGHGGNMVTGETPVSQYSFVSNSDDYHLLQQAVSQETLPERNIVNSQQLLNYFDYDSYLVEPVSEQYSVSQHDTNRDNYTIATELAPSPYNRDTYLLLVSAALTSDASDKAALGFNWLKTTVKFNPRLVSEYRLIGFEKAYQASSQMRKMTVSNARQYVALYELRYNEVSSDNTIDQSQSYHQAYSSNALAMMSLSDGRSTSGQQFISQYPIDVNQQQKFFEQSSRDFRFAAAVAGLGQLINRSNYVHDFDFNELIEIAIDATKGDSDTQRADFIRLAKSVALIASSPELNKRQVIPPHQREPYPMPYPITSKGKGELPEGKQQLLIPVEPIIKPKPVNKHI